MYKMKMCVSNNENKEDIFHFILSSGQSFCWDLLCVFYLLSEFSGSETSTGNWSWRPRGDQSRRVRWFSCDTCPGGRCPSDLPAGSSLQLCPIAAHPNWHRALVTELDTKNHVAYIFSHAPHLTYKKKSRISTFLFFYFIDTMWTHEMEYVDILFGFIKINWCKAPRIRVFTSPRFIYRSLATCLFKKWDACLQIPNATSKSVQLVRTRNNDRLIV